MSRRLDKARCRFGWRDATEHPAERCPGAHYWAVAGYGKEQISPATGEVYRLMSRWCRACGLRERGVIDIVADGMAV